MALYIYSFSVLLTDRRGNSSWGLRPPPPEPDAEAADPDVQYAFDPDDPETGGRYSSGYRPPARRSRLRSTCLGRPTQERV